MLRMCVYMHSRFVENHPIRILKDGPLISEGVLSQCRASNRPTACGVRAKMAHGRRHGGLPRAAGRQAVWFPAWRPDPAEGAAREAWERGTRRAHSRCGQRAQLVGAGRRQGATGEHRGVPGWRRAGGVEAGLTLAVARRVGVERGVGAAAVAGVGGEGVGRWTGGGEGSCRCGVGAERGNHGAGERARPAVAEFPIF
jgi:hypothetical protein